MRRPQSGHWLGASLALNALLILGGWGLADLAIWLRPDLRPRPAVACPKSHPVRCLGHCMVKSARCGVGPER